MHSWLGQGKDENGTAASPSPLPLRTQRLRFIMTPAAHPAVSRLKLPDALQRRCRDSIIQLHSSSLLCITFSLR